MIQGVLLAAGAGRRYGGAKLLQARWRGRPMVEYAARNLAAVLPETVAVVADEGDELSDLLRRWGARVVLNPEPNRGMGSSIATAVRACDDAHGWVIALADMPWVRTDTIRRVAETLGQGADAVAPYFEGQRGHPVGFSSRLRAALLALNGAAGARSVLEAVRQPVRVDVDDPGVLLDVDRPSDLQRGADALDRSQ